MRLDDGHRRIHYIMFAASMQFGKYLFKENKKKLEQKLSLKTSATSKMLWHPWNKYDAMKRGTFREQEQNMSWQFKRMTAETKTSTEGQKIMLKNSSRKQRKKTEKRKKKKIRMLEGKYRMANIRTFKREQRKLNGRNCQRNNSGKFLRNERGEFPD